jgi:DNA-binding PadR family transcriptional regulator
MLSDVCRHYATSGELSQTGITDGPGTLYRTIQALLRDGLTEESEDRPEADDERRRY